MNSKQNIIVTTGLFILFSATASFAQRRGIFKDPNFIIAPSTPISLEKELQVFNLNTGVASYRITVGVDVPNNRKPMKVAYQFEPGHVFLVLQKITGSDTIHKVFGFYPVKVATSLLKKNIESQIKDNSKREYDVELSKVLTEKEFQTVLNLALLYSKKQYHLNKFNCYDYVLQVFNSVAGNDTLPCMYVRYPLFFGKGGSPCSLYKYMKQQIDSGTTWASHIRFGDLIAPVSTQLQEQVTGNK